MIKQQGIIVSIENHGQSILIENVLTLGASIMLHPGPVTIVQDGDIPKLNRNMYVALASLKSAFERGITDVDTQELLQFIDDVLTKIESDPDLVKQVKE